MGIVKTDRVREAMDILLDVLRVNPSLYDIIEINSDIGDSFINVNGEGQIVSRISLTLAFRSKNGAQE